MPRWIDLRYENNALMDGDSKTVPQGFWGVIRIMRVGEYSKYWNHIRQESIGGAKWNYDDFIVRVIEMPAMSVLSAAKLRTSEADVVYSGLEDVNSQIFAIEAKNRPPLRKLPRVPNEEDLLFAINKHESRKVPTPPFKATDRYNITGVIPTKGDHGRIEIIYLSATRVHGES